MQRKTNCLCMPLRAKKRRSEWIPGGHVKRKSSLPRSQKLRCPPVLRFAIVHLVGFPHGKALATQMVWAHCRHFHDLVEVGDASVTGAGTAAIKHAPFHEHARADTVVIAGLDLRKLELGVPLVESFDSTCLNLLGAGFLVCLVPGLGQAQVSKAILTAKCGARVCEPGSGQLHQFAGDNPAFFLSNGHALAVDEPPQERHLVHGVLAM